MEACNGQALFWLQLLVLVSFVHRNALCETGVAVQILVPDLTRIGQWFEILGRGTVWTEMAGLCFAANGCHLGLR